MHYLSIFGDVHHIPATARVSSYLLSKANLMHISKDRETAHSWRALDRV